MANARLGRLAKLLIVLPLLVSPGIGVCSHCLAAVSLAQTIAADEAVPAEGGCSKCKAEKKQDSAKPTPIGGNCCSKNPSDSHGVAQWARSPEPAHDFWTGFSAQVEVRVPFQGFAATAVLLEYPPPSASPPIFRLISLLRV